MKSAVAALGVDPKRLTVLISQMVTLKRGQEVVRVSKRTGEFVTLRELSDEVGLDACRYFFLARSPASQMEFDLELAKQESAENPVLLRPVRPRPECWNLEPGTQPKNRLEPGRRGAAGRPIRARPDPFHVAAA